MELKVKGVEGLETVFDFNPNDDELALFVKTRSFWETNDYRPRDIEVVLENLLQELVKPYFSKLDLSVKASRLHEARPDIDFVRIDDEISVHCKGTKIIPGREDYLDGYEPIFRFYTSQKSFRAAAVMDQDGDSRLWVITDILKRAYSKGDGISMPKLGFVEDNETFEGSLVIASMDQIPRFLKAAQQLYARIGDANLTKLSELIDGRRCILNQPHSPVSEEHEAVRVLREEYNRRIGQLCFPDL